jgi:UPF0716 protein FxsA
LLDGFAILLGGALLLTPGILTDLVGFSFLLPPTRKVLLGRIRRSLERKLKTGAIRVTHVTEFQDAAAGLWMKQAEWGSDSPDPSGEIVIEPEETRDG